MRWELFWKVRNLSCIYHISFRLSTSRSKKRCGWFTSNRDYKGIWFTLCILLVTTKMGDYRMCVEYRALKAKTINYKCPLPRGDEHLERLKGFDFFTFMGLSLGHHQMASEFIQWTAFVTPDGTMTIYECRLNLQMLLHAYTEQWTKF